MLASAESTRAHPGDLFVVRSIHDTAIVGPDVQCGDEVTIGPYAVITGRVRIGSGVWIGAHAVIGAPPEVRALDPSAPAPLGSSDGVIIGPRTVIREAVQVHAGWRSPTVIGVGGYIMNQVYIAHDGQLGDDVTLAAGVRVGGHVRIDDGANLGLGTVVHQRRVIGALAMIGMGSVVTRDVPPFAKAYGAPAIVRGVNTVGLERSGASDGDLRWARTADLTRPESVPDAFAPAFAWFAEAGSR